MGNSQEKNFILELGLRLKKVRNAWRLTQKDMAQRLGIALSSYQYYERGERDVPATVFNRLTTLGVSPLWLIAGKGPMSLEELEAQNLIRVEAGPLSDIIHFLKDFWEQADKKERYWLEVQFERCFPEYRFSVKKRQAEKQEMGNSEVA